MLTYGILTILIILIVALLALIVVAWLFMRSSTQKTSASSNANTQPIVQRFISNNLKKRAFIVQLDEGDYKVICQRYSDEVVGSGGEVAGWQALPEKPVTDSLANAVEIAQSWVHSIE